MEKRTKSLSGIPSLQPQTDLSPRSVMLTVLAHLIIAMNNLLECLLTQGFRTKDRKRVRELTVQLSGNKTSIEHLVNSLNRFILEGKREAESK